MQHLSGDDHLYRRICNRKLPRPHLDLQEDLARNSCFEYLKLLW